MPRMPAEWEEQSGVMLTWPHGSMDWGAELELAEVVFAEIAHQVSLRERVLIVCGGEDSASRAKDLCVARGAVEERLHVVATVPSNDSWVRDHGPITVFEDLSGMEGYEQGERPLLLDFMFNGWGLKYAADNDNVITRRLHAMGAFGKTAMTTLGMVLEGGAIESDGCGTLLTTKSCLLSPNRNPHLSQEAVTEALQRYLGVKRVLWLEEGALAGDDTDGHIDTLARFASPHIVLFNQCRDRSDPHFDSLAKMHRELQAFVAYDGTPYRLVPLPLPDPCYNASGRRLPATYANFLMINGAVLVPTYGQAAKDQEALATLASIFPNREVVAIDCSALIAQNGSLHCVTMQLPKGVLSS